MAQTAEKARKWIEQGKDPRSAHWHAGLESVMEVLEPYLEPGRLSLAQPLEEKDFAVFSRALEVVDLSPHLRAVFLQPAIADKVVPPESATELQRAAPGGTSWKILVARAGDEARILCAEVSGDARKPGVDIFQEGALLGSYDFSTQKECLESLNKILRAHVWEKGRWSLDAHMRYTLNWFERVLMLEKSGICVQEDASFFHTPTLIKSNRVDAIFTLILEVFRSRVNSPDAELEEKLAAIRDNPDAGEQETQYHEMAEENLLRFLAVMKDCSLVAFDSFTDRESRQFQEEFARTLRKMTKILVPGGTTV
ncbi:MAG: hypothetical protein R6X08_10140 [Desulfosalsimonadaceae bacterium]